MAGCGVVFATEYGFTINDEGARNRKINLKALASKMFFTIWRI